jgi:hypothetical protein
MLTFGHIATSYILGETLKGVGVPITNPELVIMVIIGNLPDIDFFAGYITGKKGEAHHQNITHTPLGVFGVWLLAIILLKPTTLIALAYLASILLHLVLDDFGYWLYKLKLVHMKMDPQINWLFPLRPYSSHSLIISTKKVLKHYLFSAYPISLLELAISLIAILLFLISSH